MSNLQAFLDMIAVSEIGPELLSLSDNGYNVIVGSTSEKPLLFSDYSDHPRKKIWLPKLKVFSSAAGRYQILARNYDAYRYILKLPDFSPSSQDAIAIQLIHECRAREDIEQGHLATAISKCRSRWASLPGAGYGQHENSYYKLAEAFRAAGGRIA